MMPTDLPIPAAVSDFCRADGWGAIEAAQTLKGGAISLTRRLTTARGSLILKQSTQAPPDLYRREGQGLAALNAAGLSTPPVLASGDDFLLLADVGSTSPAGLDWAQAGRAIATLHKRTSPRFGFDYDNYLGLLPQRNSWMDDGHAFFGQQRILRYLSEPLCEQTLTVEDRQQLERLVARLPQLIPVQPASLLHGDLWVANVIAAASGEPTFIDPAVYYGWAEAELSMARQYEGIPAAFFDAYVEVRPLEPGWWDRLELLYLRELLSIVAHFGSRGTAVNQLRAIVAKFL